jgi:superfamily II helicase
VEREQIEKVMLAAGAAADVKAYDLAKQLLDDAKITGVCPMCIKKRSPMYFVSKRWTKQRVCTTCAHQLYQEEERLHIEEARALHQMAKLAVPYRR